MKRPHLDLPDTKISAEAGSFLFLPGLYLTLVSIATNVKIVRVSTADATYIAYIPRTWTWRPGLFFSTKDAPSRVPSRSPTPVAHLSVSTVFVIATSHSYTLRSCESVPLHSHSVDARSHRSPIHIPCDNSETCINFIAESRKPSAGMMTWKGDIKASRRQTLW